MSIDVQFEHKSFYGRKLMMAGTEKGNHLCCIDGQKAREDDLGAQLTFFFLFQSKHLALEWCNPQRLVHPFSANLIKTPHLGMLNTNLNPCNSSLVALEICLLGDYRYFQNDKSLVNIIITKQILGSLRSWSLFK